MLATLYRIAGLQDPGYLSGSASYRLTGHWDHRSTPPPSAYVGRGLGVGVQAFSLVQYLNSLSPLPGPLPPLPI